MMLGGSAELITGTVSWLSSGTVVVSHALRLSNRITSVLKPPEDSELTVEERHLLFKLNSYLLGSVQPLSLCQAWGRNRSSDVDEMVAHAESIIIDCIKTARPLLQGQRPGAAITYFNGTTNAVRSQFRQNLEYTVEKMQVAMDLLRTALAVIQTSDALLAQTAAGSNAQKMLCLVTLLAAHRQIVETEHCQGLIAAVPGKLFVHVGLLARSARAEVANEFAFKGRRLNYLGGGAVESAERGPHVAAPERRVTTSGGAEGREAPHSWHSLHGSYELCIAREESHRGLVLVAAGRHKRRKSVCQHVTENSLKFPLAMDISGARQLSWSDSHESLEQIFRQWERSGAECACCSAVGQSWLELEVVENETEAFEKVDIVLEEAAPLRPVTSSTGRRGRKKGSKLSQTAAAAAAAAVQKSGSKLAVEQRLHCIAIPFALFESTDAACGWLPSTPALLFVVNGKRKGEVLKFVYMARLLSKSVSSESHESLLRLLSQPAAAAAAAGEQQLH